MNPRPAITTTLTMIGLVAIAAAPFNAVFRDSSWLVTVIGAVVAGAMVASAVETFLGELRAPAVVAGTVLGALAWATAVGLRGVFWSAPTADSTWRELGDAVFGGWGALLEEQIPLPDPRSAQTFAAVLAWIAAAAAVHVAVRLNTALGGVVGAGALLTVATAASLPAGLAPAILGAGAGAMALFVIATITRAPDQQFRPRRLAALVAVVGLASGTALIVGAMSSSVDRDPVDPRSSRNTETVDLVVPDILAEYGVRSREGRSILTVEGAAPPSELRLRLQVYETHDGERWLPASGFEDIASFPAPELLPPGDLVSFTVVLEDLDGPWLPLPDHLIDVEVADFQWSDATQTALVGRDIESFEFTGTVVGRTGLGGLDGAREEVPPGLSEVPAGLPDEIRVAAETATVDATDAITTIDALTALLRDLGRDDNRAPGNSFGRLRDDLAADRATGPEQIASLHALMLRAVGIPSRVVVGYLATGPLVESSDLHVWTEAALPGVGWVPLDPVPPASESNSDSPDDPTVTTTSAPADSALQARALPRELGPGEDPDEPAIGDDGALTAVETVALVFVALLTALATMIAIRVIRRRVRRSSGWRAEVRVLGAWAELVDRMREIGAPIASTTTIDDVVYMAEEMDEQLGEHAGVIADVAAIALHGPHGSHPDDAALAWDQLHEAEQALERARGRLVVLRRLMDPRVLRYRAPKPPESRNGGRRSRSGTT